jgi:hypothetical protein
MEFVIQPIVGLLISESHQPSCFEFKTNQSYAFDLNPTNGKRNNKFVLPGNRIEVCESYAGTLVKFGNNKNNLESE